MIDLFDFLARPILRALDPEQAHRLAIAMLKCVPLPRTQPEDRRLATRAFGLHFPNPVGIAAGFDKHAEAPDALLRLGFGFAEVGTITPLAQPGNPRPRLFRLEADRAVINRLGFNSEGAEAVLARLVKRVNARPTPGSTSGAGEGGIVGVNIGANKEAPDRIRDYVDLIERFAPVASYITINVSSPNTPGLRHMQQAAVLDDLLARVVDARERAARNAGPTPVLLKIAPDLSLAELDDVVGIARSRRIDGMIVGNTTISRPHTLRNTVLAKEAGGLSGQPLRPLANRMLAETYVRVEGVFPLIGVGGIDCGKAALDKIRAGATLIQVYSGLVFRGLALVGEIRSAMLAVLDHDRRDSLKQYVGVDAASVAAEEWPQ
ncbi:MAG: quinone-dependent dihydroorotate dehydrogenase [Xanthobacteraceae bacterium]